VKIAALFSAVAFALGLAIGAGATGSHYRAKIASMKTEQAQREAEIATTVLETQQNQITQMETALNVAQKQTIQARADADAATAANRKLRESLASYRARYATAIASSGAGEPNSDPVGVLADLLGRMGEAGERISRYADEVKIAGAACEAAWPTHANFESKP
jgi:accessory colonization factor AcfC